MTVRFAHGHIRLEGDCPVEDAELLLQLAQQHPSAAIDLDGCGTVHMAVAQLLLAARRPVHGTPASVFVREWLVTQLLSAVD
jgi:hypothetical protein